MDNTKYTTEHRKGQHLLSEERHEIEVRLKDGWTVYRIAKHPGRPYAPTSIRRFSRRAQKPPKFASRTLDALLAKTGYCKQNKDVIIADKRRKKHILTKNVPLLFELLTLVCYV